MRTLLPGALIATAILVACAEPEPRPAPATVTQLPNGATLRVHAERPEGERWTLREAARIGSADGPVEQTFGDVRGLERDADGNIVVLDYQAHEIRRYTPGGEYIETLARGGDGPGEIGDANGLFYDATGTLWINDHDHRMVTGLGPDGSVRSVRMPVTSYGYLWEGTVTTDGWTWDRKTASAAPVGSLADREPGLISTESLVFLNGTNLDQTADPASRAVDSVLIGRYATTSVYLVRGWAQVPHSPRFLMAVDPAGAVWTAWGGEYRLTKQSTGGDTLVIVEMPTAGLPVTSAQRAEAIDNLESFMRDVGTVAALDYDDFMPTNHPVIDQLLVDDAGRVWAGRQGPGGTSEYDVFSPDGEFIASVAGPLKFERYFIPVVRGGDFLTMVTDELDVQSVIRATIERDPG